MKPTPVASSAARSFFVTLDTEGDNAWEHPRREPIPTRNARYLGRFQTVCERHGLKPVYLTAHEMALDPHFVELGRDVLARGAGEIGMHLHAWNTPPEHRLPGDDGRCHPYLIEYPEEAIRAKAGFMTRLLEDTFRTTMVRHRAGRWALDERYARALVDLGYRVDCSVAPHVSHRRRPGIPGGRGGADYTRCPEGPYFVDLDDVSTPGGSPLLEVPVTVVRSRSRPIDRLRDALPAGSFPRRAVGRLAPAVRWLRPNGRNRASLLAIVDACARRGRHLEFMLHSSELMPGGSARFPDPASIDRLYGDLEALFDRAGGRGYRGATLREYREAEEVVPARTAVRAIPARTPAHSRSTSFATLPPSPA